MAHFKYLMKLHLWLPDFNQAHFKSSLHNVCCLDRVRQECYMDLISAEVSLARVQTDLQSYTA